MTEVPGTSRPSGLARVMERMLRRLLEHPYAAPLTALALSLLVGATRHLDSRDHLQEMFGWSALTVAWLPLYVTRRARDPGGRSLTTIGIAVLGSLLMGRLVALDLAFAITALMMMPQYFLLLPFPVALLCGVPPAIGSEISHRAAVLADPTNFPWGLAALRTVALASIGITFKLLAIQLEERKRLQATLAAAERKSGMLEERQRLAREIHDTLAQGFASILVHFERAEQVDGLSTSAARPHLELARSVAREGLEEARRMLAALRPEVLERRGLGDALGRVCDEWSHRTGIPASLSITGSQAPLHPDIELTVLRAAQESLINVGRHSGAKTVAVTLSYMEDVVVLDVQDDGRGFLPSATAGRGYGLTGMRERTDALQGTFSVESTPGEGTTVSISLPAVPSTGGGIGAEAVTA